MSPVELIAACWLRVIGREGDIFTSLNESAESCQRVSVHRIAPPGRGPEICMHIHLPKKANILLAWFSHPGPTVAPPGGTGGRLLRAPEPTGTCGHGASVAGGRSRGAVLGLRSPPVMKRIRNRGVSRPARVRRKLK